MKKRILMLMLAGLMAAGVAACGTQPTDNGNKIEANESQDTEASVDEAEQPSAPEETPAVEEEDAQETEQGNPEVGDGEITGAGNAIEDQAIALMDGIYHSAPGTAGSGLKISAAAGMLLDFSENYGPTTDDRDIVAACYDWLVTNEMTAEDLTESFEAVKEAALGFADDVAAANESMADCGYTLAHDSYNKALLNQVLNDIQAALDMEQ